MKIVSYFAFLLALAASAPAHAEVNWGNVSGSTGLVSSFAVMSFLESAFPAPGKSINVRLVQSDAALVVAGGVASASLEEVFSQLRASSDELQGLSDKALAEQILAVIAQ